MSFVETVICYCTVIRRNKRPSSILPNLAKLKFKRAKNKFLSLTRFSRIHIPKVYNGYNTTTQMKRYAPCLTPTPTKFPLHSRSLRSHRTTSSSATISHHIMCSPTRPSLNIRHRVFVIKPTGHTSQMCVI